MVSRRVAATLAAATMLAACGTVREDAPTTPTATIVPPSTTTTATPFGTPPRMTTATTATATTVGS